MSGDERALFTAHSVGVAISRRASTDRATLPERITVIDVTVSAPFHGDAIKAMFEHGSGLAIDMLVPYTVSSNNLEINLDAMDAVTGTRRLWAWWPVPSE